MRTEHDGLPVTAKVGAYSSIVRQSVHLQHASGEMIGQFLLVGANLDREATSLLLRQIADALNRADVTVYGWQPHGSEKRTEGEG